MQTTHGSACTTGKAARGNSSSDHRDRRVEECKLRPGLSTMAAKHHDFALPLDAQLQVSCTLLVYRWRVK